jgi:primosomal protein N' (replication factor Y)
MTVVDMKDRGQFRQHPIFSDQLIREVSKALQQKKQSLLFLNRRGTSKLVMCSSDSCEWVAECDSCELALTYHHDGNSLVCHTCGRKTKMPTDCPVCSSALSLKSLGSKAIVEEAAQLFPGARIARYDSDTSFEDSFNESHESILDGSVDILIGTQQLIKGLDLPKLALIGLVNSDLSLRFPDYSSDERTFQLITQAIGRVGRGHTEGSVVVQTYQMNNPVLKDAVAEDWHSFRDKELSDRRAHDFPPYSFIGKILFREKSYVKAMKVADEYKKIVTELPDITVEGPVPSFHHKRGQFYYVQLHIRATSRKTLLQAARKAPDGAMFDLDPITLL